MKKVISVVLIVLVLVTGCDKVKDVFNKPVKQEADEDFVKGDDIIKGSAVAYYGWKTVFLGLAAVSGYVAYQFGNTCEGICFGFGTVMSLASACLPFGDDIKMLKPVKTD